MKMHMKLLVMLSTVTVFLLLIFSDLGWHKEKLINKYRSTTGWNTIQMSALAGDDEAYHSAGKSSHLRTITETRKEQESPTQAKVAEPPKPVARPSGPQPADVAKPVARPSGPQPADVAKPVADSAKPVAQTAKMRPMWATLLLAKPVGRIEQAPGTPIKKPRYPAWWTKAWTRSATSGLEDRFVGDQPFFFPCTSRPSASKVVGMQEPRDYVSSSKNPCWYKDPELRSGLHCLPYFYLVGVAKCGTADLYRRIRLHPDVMRGSLREYHWWDRGRFGDVYNDDLPIKAETSKGTRISFREYTDLISSKQGINTIWQDLNHTGKATKIFGDSSPSYFNDVKFWTRLDGNQGCDEPRATIAQHIRHVTPNSKTILVVRHPTPRLYLRFLSRVPEKLSLRKAASFAFHRLVKKSVSMYKACFERWSIRHCAYNTTLYQRDKVKIWEGMYSVFLADWLRVFPRRQLHVIRYRDLVRDTGPVMAKLFRFLELPALNSTSMHSLVAEKWVGRREEHELKKYFGPMVPETVDMLNDFYEPFVDKFAEMLNDERFQWRDTDHL